MIAKNMDFSAEQISVKRKKYILIQNLYNLYLEMLLESKKNILIHFCNPVHKNKPMP